MEEIQKPEKQHRFRTRLKEIVCEWCEETTSHGCANIVKANNNIIRLAWAICLLASLAVCLYLIIKTLDDYFSNPVSTSISIISEVPAAFPTVSFCFINPLNTDTQVYAEIEKVLENSSKNIDYALSFYQQTSARMISYYLSKLNDTEKKAYGNTLENSMFFCKFNGDPCFADDFEWYFDFTMGNCYKFNSKQETYTVGKGGFLTSLQLQFVLGDSTTQNNYYSDMGMRVLIHNSTLSSPIVSENGIPLGPGNNYDIQVIRTFYDRLPAPYGDCIDDVTATSTDQTFLMQEMFNSLNLSTYSRKFCENLQFQVILAANCSCVNPAYPFPDSQFSRCISDTDYLCLTNAFQLVFSDPDAYFNEQCPRECDFFDYTTQVSQAAFPTEWFYNLSRIYAVRYPDVAKRISKISSYKDAKKYYLAFNIYYKDLTYQLIQETPYWTTFALFSNIGGNLGLFVGMSFLTFVEVVDLFVKFGDFLISYFYKHIKASISPTN